MSYNHMELQFLNDHIIITKIIGSDLFLVNV